MGTHTHMLINLLNGITEGIDKKCKATFEI